MNPLFRHIGIALLGLLSLWPTSLFAQYRFKVTVCSNKGQIDHQSQRKAFVSHLDDNPYTAIPCQTSGGYNTFLSINSMGYKGSLEGELDGSKTSIYAIERWVEQFPPFSGQIVGPAKTQYRVLDGGPIGAFFYNPNECEFVPNEITTSISICPSNNLSIQCSRPYAPLDSSIEFSASSLGMIPEAYQWYYSINGGFKRSWSKKGAVHRVHLSDFNGARAGDDIYIFLKTCEGYSPSIKLQFFPSLPDCKASSLSVDAPCYIGAYNELAIEFDRPFASQRKECIERVELIRLGSGTDAYSIINTWRVNHDLGTLKLRFPDQTAVGHYHLLFHGSCVSATGDKIALSSRVVPISMARPSQLTPKASAISSPCVDSLLGQITLSLAAPSPSLKSYQYFLSQNGSTLRSGNLDPVSLQTTLERLAPGNYQVYCIDINRCASATVDVLVNKPKPIELDYILLDAPGTIIDPNQVIQPNTGRIEIRSLGPDYTLTDVQWSHTAQRTAILENLSPKTYTALISYQNNRCVHKSSFNIKRLRDTLDVRFDVIQPVQCYNGADAMVELKGGSKGQQGNRHYWYNLNDVMVSNSYYAQRLRAGRYKISSGRNRLYHTQYFVLTNPKSLQLNATISPATCYGFSDGSVTLRAQGGSGDLKVTWPDLNTSWERDDLRAGSYKIVLSDANGCTLNKYVSVGQASPFMIAKQDIQTAACLGDPNAYVRIQVSGGTPPYSWQWHDGNTDSERLNLEGGIYDYQIRDAHQCLLEGSVDLRSNDPMVITKESIKHVTYYCAQNGHAPSSEHDGSIEISVSQGTPPYRFTWSNGASQAKIDRLSPGDYHVRIEDARGCVLEKTYRIEPREPLVARIVVVDSLSCFGAKDATLRAEVTGGDGSFKRYMWSHGIPVSTIKNVGPGFYSVQISDANCSSSASLNLGQPERLGLDFEHVAERCSKDGSGLLIAHAKGGTSPYEYIWSDLHSSDTIYNPQEAVYRLQLIDRRGCNLEQFAFLSHTPPMIWDVKGQDPSYTGAQYHHMPASPMDGQLTLAVKNGQAPFLFKINGAASSARRTDLDSGVFALQVIDHSGCQADTSVRLHRKPHLEVDLVVTDSIACHQDKNGIIHAVVQGGTPPYLYRWNQIFVQTTGMQDLAAGSYHIQVTDAHGIKSVDTVCLIMPDPLTLILESDSLSGWMAQDGQIRLQCMGGTEPYQISWAHGSEATTLDDLPSGTYNVSVVDAHGCHQTGSVNVYSPDSLSMNVDIDHGTYGSAQYGVIPDRIADARIALTISGGVAPYQYQWSNGAVTAQIDHLRAGVYRVLVTDAKGYQIQGEFEIKTPEPLMAQCILKKGIRCYGEGMAHVWAEVQGGTPPYRFVWGDYSFDTQDHFYHEAGQVKLTVIDALGVESVDSLWLNEPERLQVSLSPQNPSGWGAQDGYIISMVTGGTTPYDYQWSNEQSQATADNLSQGCYQLHVRDTFGCEAMAEICIESPDSLTLQAQVSHCSYSGNDELQAGEQYDDGRISLYIAGGVEPYRYQWSDASTDRDRMNLTGGRYSVTVFDANGYQVQGHYDVESPEPLQTSLSLAEGIYCHHDATAKIRSHIQGGRPPYQLRWSTGDTLSTLDHLGAGTYRLEVKDALGVISKASLSVQQPEALEVTLVADSITGFDRNDGRLQALVTGGNAPYHYFWYARDVLISYDSVLTDLGEGIYYLDVIDEAGCQTTISQVLNRPSELIVEAHIQDCSYRGSVQGKHPESPKDGRVSLKITGGLPPYQAQWEHGAQGLNIDKLDKGFYTVTVTDRKGNKVFKTFLVKQKAALILEVKTLQAIACHGGSEGALQAIVQGGTAPYRYIWNEEEDSAIIHDLIADEYVLTVMDSLDVVATYVSIVDQPSPLRLEHSLHAGECAQANSGTISLRAQGGLTPYRYSWPDGSDLALRNDLANGHYYVGVSDRNGCQLTDTITLNTPLQLSIQEHQGILCHQDSSGFLELQLCGGMEPYRYLWSTGDTNNQLKRLGTGAYSVMVWDANGDSISDRYELNEPKPLRIQEALIHNPLCATSNNGQIELILAGGSKPYVLTWSNQAYGPILSNLEPNQYSVYIRDANGCVLEEQFVIEAPEPLRAQVKATDPTCFGYTDANLIAQAQGGTAPYTIQLNPWFPFHHHINKTQTHRWEDLSPGLYLLSLTDSNACRTDTLIQILSKPQWPIYLGPTRSLCAGQIDSLTLPDTNLVYHWTLPDQSQRWGTTLIMNQGGLYRLLASDSLGCTHKDSIWVRMASDTLRSVFWVSSKVYTDEEVVIANMVFDRFDSIRWIPPKDIQVLEYTPYYLHLFFRDSGIYQVGMWVFRGQCSDYFEVDLRVHHSESSNPIYTAQDNDSLTLMVSPNPAQDHFEFTYKDPYKDEAWWQVIDVAQGRLIHQGRMTLDLNGEHRQSIPCASWPRGVYIIRAYNSLESISRKFILK